MYPAVIEFFTEPTNRNVAPLSQQPGDRASTAVAPPQPPGSLKVIFKSGDDLRQDQLIMQMINLMDSLLKKVSRKLI